MERSIYTQRLRQSRKEFFAKNILRSKNAGKIRSENNIKKISVSVISLQQTSALITWKISRVTAKNGDLEYTKELKCLKIHDLASALLNVKKVKLISRHCQHLYTTPRTASNTASKFQNWAT